MYVYQYKETEYYTKKILFILRCHLTPFFYAVITTVIPWKFMSKYDWDKINPRFSFQFGAFPPGQGLILWDVKQRVWRFLITRSFEVLMFFVFGFCFFFVSERIGGVKWFKHMHNFNLNKSSCLDGWPCVFILKCKESVVFKPVKTNIFPNILFELTTLIKICHVLVRK